MSEEYLREHYKKMDMDELVVRARNPQALAHSRQMAREELDRRYAEDAIDPAPSSPNDTEPVNRGEASRLAVRTLLVMCVMTAYFFYLEPKYGALMAVSTALGFAFVFPVAGRIIGIGLVLLSIWIGIEMFRAMPLYIALVVSLVPLTAFGIGLNMVVESFKED
ncbi:MAG: hypothetical protein A3I66_00420 [Burkholderiales bacterium RIFCSPLOWO2_02_FULL_57_36]|nr:MAG: hypothetical protein A3I66_00420 [Burkholderiales bacterium RIFCSPLOWO2_02_FULL_57_36]